MKYFKLLMMIYLNNTYKNCRQYCMCLRIHLWNKLKSYAQKYRRSYYGLLSL
jgi:hypothetical protein